MYEIIVSIKGLFFSSRMLSMRGNWNTHPPLRSEHIQHTDTGFINIGVERDREKAMAETSRQAKHIIELATLEDLEDNTQGIVGETFLIPFDSS
jgi:hypothetical protein